MALVSLRLRLLFRPDLAEDDVCQLSSGVATVMEAGMGGDGGMSWIGAMVDGDMKAFGRAKSVLIVHGLVERKKHGVATTPIAIFAK